MHDIHLLKATWLDCLTQDNRSLSTCYNFAVLEGAIYISIYPSSCITHVYMYAISSYTSMPLTDSKPVTLHLASQVTCYDIFHLEHWKSGVFRWLQLSDIPNPPDLQKQLPHTQACFYLLLWNSFFAMGAYMHTCAFFSYLVPVIIFTDWPIHTYWYRTNLACWWCSGHNSVFFPF